MGTNDWLKLIQWHEAILVQVHILYYTEFNYMNCGVHKDFTICKLTMRPDIVGSIKNNIRLNYTILNRKIKSFYISL